MVPALLHDDVKLAEIGFQSLDISEAAMLVEDEIGRELNFDAAPMRQMETVGALLDFFLQQIAQVPAHG
ncbi:acyl carrier protein [Dyella sp. M7H15-1]|nr:acyl carrier protein [Dyella sp. M7H15-1]